MNFTITDEAIRRKVLEIIYNAPMGSRVEIKGKRRKKSLNDLMWAVLTQLEPHCWHGFYLTKEEWKDFITAGLKRQKVVPGPDGGFVVIGARTSDMTDQEIADVIEFAYAFGAQQGIRFIDPKAAWIDETQGRRS
jgi:hypothetical protein